MVGFFSDFSLIESMRTNSLHNLPASSQSATQERVQPHSQTVRAPVSSSGLNFSPEVLLRGGPVLGLLAHLEPARRVRRVRLRPHQARRELPGSRRSPQRERLGRKQGAEVGGRILRLRWLRRRRGANNDSIQASLVAVL